MVEIKKGDKCFYIGESQENAKAMITWVPSIEGVIIVEHTVVNDELAGQGIGKKLVDAVAKMAREQNLKIIATCKFARHTLQGSEKYQDLLHQWGSEY